MEMIPEVNTKILIKLSLTCHPPQVMSVKWECHPWQQLRVSLTSSHRSSCAAAAVSGSGAPLPPAGPPVPPSMMTQPPPKGARPLLVCLPPPGSLLTGRMEMRGEMVEYSFCQGLWVARTQRIQKGSGRSSDFDRVTPCCTPNEGSHFHQFVLNYILLSETSQKHTDLVQVTSVQKTLLLGLYKKMIP